MLCPFLSGTLLRYYTAFQVADNGTFSGTSEAAYVLGLLQNTYSAPQNAIPCQSIVTGSLFGQPVVVITSGTPTFPFSLLQNGGLEKLPNNVQK